MKNKKFIYLLALSSALVLSGCGGDNISSSGTSDGSSNPSTPSTTQPTTPSTSDTPEEEGVLQLTIADYAEKNNWANGVQYSEFTVDNLFTFTATGGANTGKYYKSDESWRFYASESASLTISASEGVVMTSITFTYKSKSSGEILGYVSKTKVELSNLTEETFYVGESGQVQITEIRIEYDGNFVPPTTWSSDASAFFDEYLYGADIPFMYVGKAKEYLDEDNEEFVYQGGNSSASLLAGYAKLFSEDGNWTMTAEAGEEDYYYYCFEAEFNVENGTKYLNAYLYGLDEDSESPTEDGTGIFTLDVYDPYYYSWGEFDVDLTSYLGYMGCSHNIPAYENASRYALSANYYVAIVCYVDNDDDPEATYKNSLEGMDYEVSTEKDEDGLFVALPKEDADTQVSFAYSDEMGALAIIVQSVLIQYENFPTDLVKEFYDNKFTPIALEGATYYTYEYVNLWDIWIYAEVIAYGLSEDDLVAYATLLKNNDYDVSEDEDSGEYYYAYYDDEDEGYSYSLYMYYDEDSQAIVLQYRLPEELPSQSSEFPTDEIAEWLENKELTDTVPTLTIDEGDTYSYLAYSDPTGIYIDSFEIYATGNYEEAWLTILTSAGYDVPETATEYGYECISPNEEIEIDVMYDEEDDVTYAIIYSCADFYL